MVGTPIEQLQLSVRASNVLHRMGIHSVEELVRTSVEDIAQQRNVGAKTLDEIKYVIANADRIVEHTAKEFSNESEIKPAFTDEQLSEMSRHSICELGLSVRPYNVLQREGYLTIDKVAQLSEADFAQMKGLGRKSVIEIKESVDSWIQENIVFGRDPIKDCIDPDIKALLPKIASDLEPVAHVYWKQLFDYIKAAGLADRIPNNNYDNMLQTVLLLPQIQNKIEMFWEAMSNQGVITNAALSSTLDELELAFQPTLLVNTALTTGILTRCNGVLLISRDTVLEAYDKICDPSDRASQILQLRIEGERLQDIGDLYNLTRERVRQICSRLVRRFPLLFEDYFSEPYQHFHLLKSEFCRAFPEISEEGYEFLTIRYSRGKIELTNKTLNEYSGLWKDCLAEYLREKEERDDKRTVSKTEMVMRVLISNSDKPLSLDEFTYEYYSYIKRKGYPAERLKISLRTVTNHLRNTRGIVFDRDNKFRFCDADPHIVWEKVDFTQYKNTIISAELIFRDYQDIMDELDIRDGYELFYVIKNSLSMWDPKRFLIHCRRVPVIVMGEASEETQAIKLLKEISPVTYYGYYEAYEERYGLKKESAQGNPVISNAVGVYYVNGQYVIDAPTVDERDVHAIRSALREKSLWFVEDIENLFDKVCKYTTHDAINAAAFRQIGYTLHTAYAYDASYGTALNFFEKIVFSKDVVDLSALDRRIINLGMFAAALDKKKNSLEYIETAPKILMSKEKVNEVYGISINEIRQIQSMTSIFYTRPFFNGRSIWEEVKDFPAIQKLQGNDWMLTCIMRQQEPVFSLSVAGGIILSLNSTSLSLSQICEWIASLHGKMSINSLEKKINEIFGTRIPASKLAAKLKSSGSWDKVVTDSMDAYIDSLVDAGLSDVDVDDLFREEFF